MRRLLLGAARACSKPVLGAGLGLGLLTDLRGAHLGESLLLTSCLLVPELISPKGHGPTAVVRRFVVAGIAGVNTE